MDPETFARFLAQEVPTRTLSKALELSIAATVRSEPSPFATSQADSRDSAESPAIQ
jgi:hypothetical protein